MKRRVTLLLLLLVAGAIVNVAVAWGIACNSDVGGWTMIATHSGGSTVEVIPGEFMHGWPMRSLASDHTWTRGVAPRFAIRLGTFYLPYLPIWPGFAINMVFYALVLWLLFAAPIALRRRRRIKRCLCPKCAYPVGTWGGERCTECGATHKVKP